MSEGGSELESSIEGLVELEAELSDDAGAVAGTYDGGTLVGADKVPADDVPDDYPVAIPTGHALRLAVDAGDATVDTFLAWPDRGSDAGHVERLLEAFDRDSTEFADLYGDEVALAAVDGWHVLDLRRTAVAGGVDRSDGVPRRSRYAVLGAVALGAVAMVLWATPAVGTAGSLLLFLSWLAVPTAVYADLKTVAEVVPWDPDGRQWLLGSLLPLFGVPVGTAYLMRRGARAGGVAPGETVDRWPWTIVGALVLHPLTFVSAFVAPPLFGVLVLHALVLLPLSVYFDAGYLGDATDWDPDGEAWGIATALFTSIGSGWAVAVYYLAKRRAATRGASGTDGSTTGRDLVLLDGTDGEADDSDESDGDGDDGGEEADDDGEESDGDAEEADGDTEDDEDGWETAEGWGDDGGGWGTAEGWGEDEEDEWDMAEGWDDDG